MSLSSKERGALNATSTEELANACLEMKTRAFAFAKVLRVELSKGTSSKVARLKKELAVS